jgi:hypothetical protein
MNSALQLPLSDQQSLAMSNYIPTFCDDVFAFARILRDCVTSTQTTLQENDKHTLRVLYRKFMGLEKSRLGSQSRLVKQPSESGLLRRISLMFHTSSAELPTIPIPEQRWISMEQVLPEFEKILASHVALASLEFGNS